MHNQNPWKGAFNFSLNILPVLFRTFGNLKNSTMKKIVIILLALAPMVTMAQDIKKANSKTKSKTSKTDTRTKDKTGKTVEGREEATTQRDDAALRNNNYFYSEVSVSQGSSGPMIKLHLGEYKTIIRDKSLVVGLEEARAKRYNTVAGVLNQLDQLGFEVLTTYESPGRNGKDSRIVLRAENRQPNIILPERGDGNTLSKENPAMRQK